jgi:hypothetical protein
MQKIGSFIQTILTPLALLLLAGVVVHDHFEADGPSGPRSTVNGKALGRSFAPTVASNLGDAWLAAASTLEQGKTMSEAQVALQQAWQDARIKAFTAKVAPEFIKVLPEGQEPTNPAERAEVVRLWRDFASGLKGGR